MVDRRAYYVIGSLLVLLLVGRLILMVNTNTFSWVESLAWFTIAYICFAAGYLQSQVSPNDERAKYIKQKAFQYSMYMILPLIFLLTMISQMVAITFTNLELLSVLTTLSLIVTFTTWMIVAKRN